MQTKTERLNAIDSAELIKGGYDRNSINLIPHFSASPQLLTELLGFKVTCPGLAFVYQDINGALLQQANGKPFVRVKMRRTKEEIIAFEAMGYKNGKYSSPKAGGCHLYLSPLKLDWAKTADRISEALIIIEGEKKADVLCQEGFSAIGIGGVYNWKQRVEGEEGSSPIDDFNWFQWQNRVVYLCPDSDVRDEKKPLIAQAMKELASFLTGLGAIVKLIVLPHALDGAKLGADDFIVRYGVDRFKTFLDNCPPALVSVSKSTKNKGGADAVKLNLEKPNNYRQAEIISWLLGEFYAYRAGSGWYQHTGKHWCVKDKTLFTKAALNAYKQQNWELDSSSMIKYAEVVLPTFMVIEERSWNKPGYIVFENGVLNPTTGIFVEKFDKELYNTYEPLPFPYRKNPGTPKKFLEFLGEATAYDPNTVDLLQAILRYIWMPKDPAKKFEVEACFDFYGGKGTGKSTFIEIIMAGLGEASVGSADPEVFSAPEKLGSLIDKRAAISADVSGHLEKVGLFNKVVSNEPVDVRHLYQNMMTTRLGVVVIRSYNKFISVGQGSQGLDRRITAIEFNNPPKVKDIHLLTKLKSELTQIFSWAFSIDHTTMIERLLTRNDSKHAIFASVERFIDNNPVFQFLAEEFSAGDERINSKELYARYADWCKQQSMKPLKLSNFRHAIEEFGCSPILRADGSPLTHARYPLYKVPAMREFDIKSHLGFGQSLDNVELETVTVSAKEVVTEDDTDIDNKAEEIKKLIWNDILGIESEGQSEADGEVGKDDPLPELGGDEELDSGANPTTEARASFGSLRFNPQKLGYDPMAEVEVEDENTDISPEINPWEGMTEQQGINASVRHTVPRSVWLQWIKEGKEKFKF